MTNAADTHLANNASSIHDTLIDDYCKNLRQLGDTFGGRHPKNVSLVVRRLTYDQPAIGKLIISRMLSL